MTGIPEQFAPRSRKPRFATLPDAPVRPRLLAEESRFALRLSLLAGATEVCAFAAFARLCADRSFAGAVVWAALRVARPLWAFLGTRVPRGAVAFALVGTSLLVQGWALFSLRPDETLLAAAAALPALGDLCATCLGDRIPLDRRAAAWSYLDVGQGLGAAVGLAAGTAEPRLSPVFAAVALLVGSIAIPDLRGGPGERGTWPLWLRASAARTPFGAQGAVIAFAIGGFASAALAGTPVPRWAAIAAPLAGMWIAARLDPRTRNAVILPRALAVLAAGCAVVRGAGPWPIAAGTAALLLFGAAASALPASVARGSGEMERPLVSSLLWSALSLGAGVALAAVSW
ncbi:MAG: hypothetical protein ACJ79D_16110 [Myxococcales bacterium]